MLSFTFKILKNTFLTINTTQRSVSLSRLVQSEEY